MYFKFKPLKKSSIQESPNKKGFDYYTNFKSTLFLLRSSEQAKRENKFIFPKYFLK